MSITVPQGYLLAGVHCRIKRDSQKPDLTLVFSETPASAAGVYTQNLVCAAPVMLGSQPHAEQSYPRGGNLFRGGQCLHGPAGIARCRGNGPYSGRRLRRQSDQALVLSTGVIGAFLPMDKIEQGISAAAVKIGKQRGLPAFRRPGHVDHGHGP